MDVGLQTVTTANAGRFTVAAGVSGRAKQNAPTVVGALNLHRLDAVFAVVFAAAGAVAGWADTGHADPVAFFVAVDAAL